MPDICRHLELRIQDVVELGIATNTQLGKDTSGMHCSFKIMWSALHIELQVCFTMILARIQSLDLMKYNSVIWDPTLTFSEVTSLPQSDDVSCLLN